MKPVESVAQFNAQMDMYCPHLRRVSAGNWRCSLVQRATGTEPCLPEDWAGCKLNDGGLVAKNKAEKLS